MAKATGKSTRSGNFYIQPIWRIFGICDAQGHDFPPYVRIPKAAIHAPELSNEALAYYVYWIAGNQRIQEWSSSQEQELKLSPKQVKRLRAELRAAGLLTMTRAGTQTYSALHSSPIPRELRHELENKYAECIKRQWGLAQRYGVKTPVDSVTPFFQIHTGAPAGLAMVVFRESMRQATVGLLRSTRGMNRLRALGLWLKLCDKPGWHNWRTPGAIAKELGYSVNYVKTHLRELIALKLVYYDEPGKVIGISRFPDGVEESLQPITADSSHIPWKSLIEAPLKLELSEL